MLVDLILCLQSLGVHVLGQKAVVSKEEAVVAVRHVGGCSSGNRPCCRNRSAGHDYRYDRVMALLNYSQIS